MVPLPTSAASAIPSMVTALKPCAEKRSIAVDKIRDRAAIFFRTRLLMTTVIPDHSHIINLLACQVGFLRGYTSRLPAQCKLTLKTPEMGRAGRFPQK